MVIHNLRRKTLYVLRLQGHKVFPQTRLWLSLQSGLILSRVTENDLRKAAEPNWSRCRSLGFYSKLVAKMWSTQTRYVIARKSYQDMILQTFNLEAFMKFHIIYPCCQNRWLPTKIIHFCSKKITNSNLRNNVRLIWRFWVFIRIIFKLKLLEYCRDLVTKTWSTLCSECSAILLEMFFFIYHIDLVNFCV